MTLRGWLNLMDSLTPRCPRCNRKMRNSARCAGCWTRFCSESCVEKHFKLVHEAERKRQAAQAALAETKRIEQERRRVWEATLAELRAVRLQKEREAEAALAKKRTLEHLKAEIDKAAKVCEERNTAWREAGSPEIPEAELDSAKEEAGRRWAAVREEKKERSWIQVRLAYLKAARWTRSVRQRLGDAVNVPRPTFVTAACGGMLFGLVSVPAVVLTHSLWFSLAIGILGFLAGLSAVLCLLLVPDDDKTTARIAFLEGLKGDVSENLEAANEAYEEAQERYDELASLDDLRVQCQAALAEKERLEGAYVVASAE